MKKTEIGKESAILAACYALYCNNGLRQDQFDFLVEILNSNWGDYAAIGVVYGLSSKSFDGKQFIDASFNGTKKYPAKSNEENPGFSLNRKLVLKLKLKKILKNTERSEAESAKLRFALRN